MASIEEIVNKFVTKTTHDDGYTIDDCIVRLDVYLLARYVFYSILKASSFRQYILPNVNILKWYCIVKEEIRTTLLRYWSSGPYT